MTIRIINADVLAGLAQLPDESVHCVVTSPPYWGLRDYGTGQWEGGDGDCEHVAGMARQDNGRKSDTFHGHSNGQGGTIQFREECGHCGARRIDNQIGLEPTLAEHIERLVGVFEQVRRVLRPDGVLFLNYGDAYAGGGRGNYCANDSKQATSKGSLVKGTPVSATGLKPKDLCLIPERLSIALQDSGWWVRSRIIWHKSNPMPESANDRPTSSHEHVYMLTKNGAAPLFWVHERGKGGSRVKPAPDHIWTHKATGEERTEPPTGYDDDPTMWTRRNLWRGSAYWWDAEAVREVAVYGEHHAKYQGTYQRHKIEAMQANGAPNGDQYQRGLQQPAKDPLGRNLRNVWTIATHSFPDAHFATFAPKLVETCLKAGCPEKVCADCGAPYVREVERGPAEPLTPSDAGRKATWTIGDGARNPDERTDTPLPRHHRPKIGESFSPSCDCQAETARGTVLDPFGGSGTTGLVADRMNRNAILIELNSEYAAMARRRIEGDAGLFANMESG